MQPGLQERPFLQAKIWDIVGWYAVKRGNYADGNDFYSRELYRGMEKENMRPADALRAAQIKMLKEKRWRAPYYWAGFQIQGEWK